MIGWTVFSALLVAGFVFSPLPPLINRFVFIPRGRVRLAHRIGLISLQGWKRDRRGAALVAGARAAFRLPPERREGARTWLEHKCQRLHRIRSGGLVGCGLLAALRGDRETARTVLRAIERLDSEYCSPRAYEVAREWLAADAATEGRWEDVVQIASRTPHQSFATEFLGLVGARLLGDAVYASDAALRRAWQLLPNRRECRPLLDRALASKGKLKPSSRLVLPASSRDESADPGLALYVELLVGGVPSAHDVRKLAKIWDERMSDEGWRAQVRDRAEALGLRARDPASAVVRSVEDAVAGMLAVGDMPVGELAESEGMLGRLANKRRASLIGELEVRLQKLRTQLDDVEGLDPLDALHSFLAVVEVYEGSVRSAGLDVRREAFKAVCEVASPFGDWLIDERREKALARAVFRWLFEESKVSGTPHLAGQFGGKIAAT